MIAPQPKLVTILGIILLIVFGLTACDSDEPASLPANGQPVTAVATIPTASPTALPPTITPPTPLPDTPQPTPLPAPAATPLPPAPLPATAYRVAFVADDDVLNVRTGPGVENALAGMLAYNATAVSLTGAAETVASSVWVPITHEGLNGWVNRYFLTEAVSAEPFCADPAVAELINQLKSSLSAQNGEALASLVHPQRGLLIRHEWWNPEVKLSLDEVAQLFSDSTARDWGTGSGSGLPITGSTVEIILPLLEKDLLNSTVSGCNQVVGGNTTGILRLPPTYEALNFVSQYRPATDEFDWGTWAIGIEYWAGKPYLAFLIHYTWEI